MSEAWWIRRWYFLYISVFTTLPNFRETCHEKFSVLHTFLDLMQTLNNLQTHYVRLSKTKLHSYYATFVYPILMPFLYLHSFIKSQSFNSIYATILFQLCLVPQIILDKRTPLQTYLVILQNFILFTFQIFQVSILNSHLLPKLFQVFLLNKFRDEIS